MLKIIYNSLLILVITKIFQNTEISSLCKEEFQFNAINQDYKYIHNNYQFMLGNYSTLSDAITYGTLLGSGAFGKVYSIPYKGVNSVIKIQELSNFNDNNYSQVTKEIENLKDVSEAVYIFDLAREIAASFYYMGDNNIKKEELTIKELDDHLNNFLLSMRNEKYRIFSQYIEISQKETQFKNLLNQRLQDFFYEFTFQGKTNYNNMLEYLKEKIKSDMVLEFYECVYNQQTKKIYIILESLDGTFEKESSNFLTFPQPERLKHYNKLIVAIRKLHTQLNKVHLDIKPDNIMFSKINNEYNFKFIDYGLMNEIGSPLNIYCKIYAHPDLINRTFQNGIQPYFDVYALVLTIACIEFGENVIRLDKNCYKENNYTEDCFLHLRSNIVMAFCQRNNDLENCKSMDYNTIIDIYKKSKECKDLGCFVFVNLRYDGRKMAAKLRTEDKAMIRGNGKVKVFSKELEVIIKAIKKKKKRLVV